MDRKEREKNDGESQGLASWSRIGSQGRYSLARAVKDHGSEAASPAWSACRAERSANFAASVGESEFGPIGSECNSTERYLPAVEFDDASASGRCYANNGGLRPSGIPDPRLRDSAGKGGAVP
ncbi:hypothetical protein R1flu_019606 [Riccia fluitans]|uniref:Uncharacterized protein n=1 Tax=Riccia fluitans TaxID=41844 RepID=A0ABD1ZJ49_9MARC